MAQKVRGDEQKPHRKPREPRRAGTDSPSTHLPPGKNAEGTRGRDPMTEMPVGYFPFPLAPICRSSAGSYMPITHWHEYADHQVARIWRSLTNGRVSASKPASPRIWTDSSNCRSMSTKASWRRSSNASTSDSPSRGQAALVGHFLMLCAMQYGFRSELSSVRPRWFGHAIRLSCRMLANYDSRPRLP